MRKTQILMAVSLLLLLATCAFAYHRPLAKPCYGDPDEFQALRVHDEGGERIALLGCSRGRPRTVAGTGERERREPENQRRYLSINFAGRTFFLER